MNQLEICINYNILTINFLYNISTTISSVTILLNKYIYIYIYIYI